MFRDNASIYIEKLTNRFLCQPYIVILHTDFNAIFMGILVNTRKSTVLFRICNFVFLLSSIMYHHPIIPYQNYFYFSTAFINIVLILTLRTAKYSTRSACDKGLQTVLAQTDRFFRICQHETEHHLYPQQHGMEIPYNRRLIQKSDMISWRIAAVSCHALLHHQFCVLIYGVVVLIIEHTRHIGKCPVGKLLLHPIVAFRIFSLKLILTAIGLSVMVIASAIIMRSFSIFHMDSTPRLMTFSLSKGKNNFR